MLHDGTARAAAPLTLLLLAPVIGEVLFGAVPLSLLPFGLLGLIGIYGGGALLVREIVRGRGLPRRGSCGLESPTPSSRRAR